MDSNKVYPFMYTEYTSNIYKIHICNKKKLLSIIQFDESLKSNELLKVIFVQLDNIPNIKYIRLLTNDKIFELCSVQQFKILSENNLTNITIILNELIENEDQQMQIIEHFHSDIFANQHNSIGQTIKLIRLNFYWEELFSKVRKYVKSCTECTNKSQHIFVQSKYYRTSKLYAINKGNQIITFTKRSTMNV